MLKDHFKPSLFLIFLLSAIHGMGQGGTDLHFEFQAYPTGLIPGIRIEKNLTNGNAVHVRLGYNWIRHRDLGVHDDERGDGIGFSLGYKKYFSSEFKGWSLGIRNDFWWNSIDWRDDEASGQVLGHTDITVIQPTLELTYLFEKPGISFAPSIALGYEWNVKTNGEPTGEGAILLVGIQIGKRIN